MPEEMVSRLETQFRRKGIPSWIKEVVPSWESKSLHDVAEAAVAIIINARKKRANGGDVSENTKAFFNYSQVPEYSREVLPAKDGGVWILAIDEAASVKSVDGRGLKINPLAHMVAMTEWAETTTGHVDHRPEMPYGYDVLDSRYTPNEGLYLNIKPSDDFVERMFLSNDFRSSPEVTFNNSDVKDGVIQRYQPTGIGAMNEGNPIGNTFTASPEVDSIPAQGGNMSDEDNPDPQEGNNEENQAETPDADADKENDNSEPEAGGDDGNDEAQKLISEKDKEIDELRSKLEKLASAETTNKEREKELRELIYQRLTRKPGRFLRPPSFLSTNSNFRFNYWKLPTLDMFSRLQIFKKVAVPRKAR